MPGEPRELHPLGDTFMLVMDDSSKYYAYPTGGTLWKFRAELVEVTPVDLVKASGVVRIPAVKGVQYFRGGVAVPNGSQHIITSNVTFTASPVPGYIFPNGDWSWAFSPNMVDPDDLGMVNNTVRIPNIEGVLYRMNGVGQPNGSVIEITERTTFTAVPREGYVFPPGDDYTWVFEPAPEASSDFRFPFPRNKRNAPYRNHAGIDWAGNNVGNSAAIKCIGPGVVRDVYNDGRNTSGWGSSGTAEPVWRGRCVVVNHGSIGGRTIWSLYAHMDRVDVSEGQTVNGGTVLGEIGNTGYSFGTHLHHEVIYNGQRLNTSVGGGYERTLGWLDANADGSW